jgi:hypothetical protein
MASQIIIRNNIPILNAALLEAYGDSLAALGKVAEIQITATIDRGVPPPNAPSTVKAKGSSQTLIDSSEMYNAISSEVRGNSVVFGVMGSESAATKALMNEFGTVSIPERSFIRRTINDKMNRDEMNEEVKTKIRAAIKDAALK